MARLDSNRRLVVRKSVSAETEDSEGGKGA